MTDEEPQLISVPLIQIPNSELGRSTKASQTKKKSKKSAAKKSGGAAGGPFGFLKATNDWLEGVPSQINAAYSNLLGNGEAASQAQVDVVCEWLAWKVNIAVERKRQAMLKVLYGQYESTAGGMVMKAASVVTSFVSNPLGAIGSFAGVIFGPATSVFKWVTELVTEVIRLGSNLAAISSSLPPEPPSPNINYDKFKLKISSISLAQVMSDPSSLPAPEVMFPEPEKPFSKDTFAKGFETATASLKSTKQVYTLKEEDKKTLEAMNTPNSSVYALIAAAERAEAEVEETKGELIAGNVEIA